MTIDDTVLLKMQADIANLTRMVADIANEKKNREELIFNKFRHGEHIALTDKRLWQDGVPFKSQDAARYAKRKGCPFFTLGTLKVYFILADDLYDWCTNKQLRCQIMQPQPIVVEQSASRRKRK